MAINNSTEKTVEPKQPSVVEALRLIVEKKIDELRKIFPSEVVDRLEEDSEVQGRELALKVISEKLSQEEQERWGLTKILTKRVVEVQPAEQPSPIAIGIAPPVQVPLAPAGEFPGPQPGSAHAQEP